ncbi:hypothetical protein ABPG74_014391 [Tetrahymena malaccensis]
MKIMQKKKSKYTSYAIILSKSQQNQYLQKSNYFLYQNSNTVLEQATKEEDYQQIIDQILQQVQNGEEDIQKCLKDLKKCLDEYFNHHNQKNFAPYFRKSLKQLIESAISFLNQEKLDMSLIILNECDMLVQTFSGFPDMQILTYNNLSCYFRKCKDQKRALKLLEKAENIYSKNQTTTNMGITFLNKSAILSEMGRHQEAIKCAKASVKELKNQFEKVFEQKKLHQEKYLNMKNFKNSMLSNSKVDNSKLEEDFYQREEQTKQINLEFQDIATELGIAYHNLATEEQYFKLFDRSIKNFFNAYTIVKEYLGDNHPLTSQFHQSFQAVNKKYQQHISNSNENDQGKQKKFHNKINESPEYYSKDLNSIQINNNELAAIKTQNSIEDVNAQEEKEHKQSFKNNDIQLQRKNITSQQDAKNRNMLKKQVEGTVIDYKQQMKAINLNMYNLLYSDDDGDEGQNEMQIPNTQARIELYKNKYQQPPQGKSTVSHKKPQIYNQMYFDNLKEMNQFKIKQQKTLENQEQTNNKNMKVSKASDLIENLMESPKSTEKRINIFEIDQMLIRRNKSNQTQRQKGGSDLNFGQTQYKYGQDPKEQQAADLNHPAFFLAKKMQGKYTKLSTIRPMTAQEILDSPPQKKEVGGRKYKVNPKLLIPDTVIEATNRYQDYLQREKQQNQKKSFVIKSTSTKNISQSDKEKHEKMFNLEDINTDQENAKFDKKNLKTQQDSQSQKALPQGKHQSSEKNISKGGQENDNNNFKQKLEQMKQKIVLNQQESERLKNQNKKWNFETIKDDQTNQEKNNYKSQQSQQKRGEAAYYSTKIPTKSQDRRIHSQSGNFEAATQIPQEYQIVSPYMNSTVRAKSSLVSAIQKGRMCCVFDENSYNLIIAFQDIQSGQGVDMEDQCRFYINLSNLREIFSKEDDSKYQTHQQHSKHYNQYLQDHPQEFNDAKLHMLRYNLETLFKKFKPLLSIDIEKKCLVVEQNFSGYTVQIKTPLHPKGIVTKLNFYSQNSSIFTLPSSKNSSESQKNLKNMLVVEYPAEELFLQKENKKLEELEENYIILQKFVYASLSNKQGMLATLFNTNTLQLQFNFKSLDQQVDIFHYVVVEPIIQDYGPYFESEDTQIALSILCENLVTMWKYDGKNLTYDKKDKWSLKNEVEIPNQGKKQLQYQIIQQPSNDFSIIQKKEAWIEIYEDDNLEFQINKKELLDKIDESHESEDESKQEKIPFSNQHYKPNQSQFSQNEKGNHSNQPSKKFQIVNKYEEEEYEFDDEDEKNQNVDKTQPHTKNQDNQSKNSSRIPSKHESNQDIKENISNGFQKQQKIEQKQSNIDDQYKIDKENIQKPNRNSQKEKEDFSKLQQPNNTSQNQQLDSDQRKQSSRQNSVLNETNGGDSSKNTRQKNLSNQFARPQSSKKQMDIRNNLSKGSPLNNLENQDILDFESSKQVRQAYDQQNQDEDEEDKYNDQQKLHQQDQINKEERKSSVIYQSTNQNKNQDNKNNVHTQNEQKDIAVNEFKQQGDNCSKKVQNRERPEATYSKSRNNSIKIQQEQIKNNYSLNISQEKEGDVEYIDINDTQQIV